MPGGVRQAPKLPFNLAPTASAAQPCALGIVGELALAAQRQAGWKESWPFVPVDLGNADFLECLALDPDLPPEELQLILRAGAALGVVAQDCSGATWPRLR